MGERRVPVEAEQFLKRWSGLWEGIGQWKELIREGKSEHFGREERTQPRGEIEDPGISVPMPTIKERIGLGAGQGRLIRGWKGGVWIIKMQRSFRSKENTVFTSA